MTTDYTDYGPKNTNYKTLNLCSGIADLLNDSELKTAVSVYDSYVEKHREEINSGTLDQILAAEELCELLPNSSLVKISCEIKRKPALYTVNGVEHIDNFVACLYKTFLFSPYLHTQPVPVFYQELDCPFFYQGDRNNKAYFDVVYLTGEDLGNLEYPDYALKKKAVHKDLKGCYFPEFLFTVNNRDYFEMTDDHALLANNGLKRNRLDKTFLKKLKGVIDTTPNFNNNFDKGLSRAVHESAETMEDDFTIAMIGDVTITQWNSGDGEIYMYNPDLSLDMKVSKKELDKIFRYLDFTKGAIGSATLALSKIFSR